jgi:hypothetical protein
LRIAFLAGAALALAAGCGKPPEPPAPDPSGGVTLAAPPPSPMTSPLGPATSGYTNEMQAQNLRAEAAELGINRFGKPSVPLASDDGEPSGETQRTITYQEGIQRTRSMAREVEAERHAIDRDKNKTVAIPTTTAGVLPPNKAGAPIESPGQAQDPP